MSEAVAPSAQVTFPIILSGPSGAGKTTLRDRLLGGASARRFLFSVSMTTRNPRSGETDGGDYRFVDRATFEELVESRGMLEYAVVHGDLYGTPRSNLDAARASGRHLLLDIDVQGARQVRAVVPEAVSIMVLPPSAREMLRRLEGRGSETPEQLSRRYESAVSELDAVGEFGYVVVNESLADALDRVIAIVAAEERSVSRVGAEAEEFARRLKGEIEARMQ